MLERQPPARDAPAIEDAAGSTVTLPTAGEGVDHHEIADHRAGVAVEQDQVAAAQR